MIIHKEDKLEFSLSTQDGMNKMNFSDPSSITNFMSITDDVNEETVTEDSDKDHFKPQDVTENPYNLRMLQSKTSWGEFEREFYNYKYILWPNDDKHDIKTTNTIDVI